MTERWRPVPGYEGEYEVSDAGNVKRLARQIDARRPDGSVRSYMRPERMQKLGRSEYGYVVVTIKSQIKKVHRLVLLAFLGSPPPGMEGCHNDGDQTNNHISNLRWDTAKANSADRAAHGRTRQGEQAPKAKLTREQAASIRAGVTLRADALALGICQATYSAIRHGRIWRRELAGLPMVGRIRGRR